MKLCRKYIIGYLFSIVFIGGLFCFPCKAQVSNGYYFNSYGLSPFYSNFNNFSNLNPYVGWGISNPYLSLLPYNNPMTLGLLGLTGMPFGLGYSGNNLLNQTSLQGPSLMELVTTYNYLNYSANFYQMASQVPLLYTRDIQADQIGALLYSYAKVQEVSLQDAIYHFIQQMYIQ